MGLLSLEHSQTVYWADFAWHGAVALGLAAAVGWSLPAAPDGAGLGMALALVLAGMLLWSLTEYLPHRFVLHGLPPFRQWHALHHRRPQALICGPTLLSSGLITLLVSGGGPWMHARRRWHALHHHARVPGGYGVGTSLWDHVFASVPTPDQHRPTTSAWPDRRPGLAPTHPGPPSESLP